MILGTSWRVYVLVDGSNDNPHLMAHKKDSQCTLQHQGVDLAQGFDLYTMVREHLERPPIATMVSMFKDT